MLCRLHLARLAAAVAAATAPAGAAPLTAAFTATARLCRLLRLGRADTIAAYFCSVKKTLAMGVPLAALIFGARADLPLILLPIMLYHPVQLFVNGLLAHRWAQAAPER